MISHFLKELKDSSRFLWTNGEEEENVYQVSASNVLIGLNTLGIMQTASKILNLEIHWDKIRHEDDCYIYENNGLHFEFWCV